MTVLDEMLVKAESNVQESEQERSQEGGGCGCSIKPEEVNRVEIFGMAALTGDNKAIPTQKK